MNPIGAGIIANGLEIGSRAGGFTALLEALLNGLEGFGCLHASGDDQLGRHLWVDPTEAVIGGMVQREVVTILTLPSITTHRIEALRRLRQGFEQGNLTRWVKMEFEAQGG